MASKHLAIIMNKPDKCALITGGNGNLGRLVADRLLEQGQSVVKFDLPGTEPKQSGDREFIVSGDIRDSDLLGKLITEYKVDTIYHLASLLSGSSEANLSDAWAINATASFDLLKLANEAKVDRFFFAGTIATYGTVEQDPMMDDYPQWPDNLYGATKVAVERLGVYFKRKHGLDFRCLRFPLVVSPYAPKTAVTAFPAQAFKSAIAGEPYTFPVSEQTGMSTIFLDDVVDSIVVFTAAPKTSIKQNVYNLHAYYLSAGRVADFLKKRFPGFEYRFEPVAAVDHLISSWPDEVDDSAARRDWGWNPAHNNFELSAERMVGLLGGG